MTVSGGFWCATTMRPKSSIKIELLGDFDLLHFLYLGLKILGFDNIGRIGSSPIRGTIANNFKDLSPLTLSAVMVLSNRIWLMMDDVGEWSETKMRPNLGFIFPALLFQKGNSVPVALNFPPRKLRIKVCNR